MVATAAPIWIEMIDEARGVELLREFDRRIVVEGMPEIAGRWAHHAGPGRKPPSAGHVRVDREMRELCHSFHERLDDCAGA